MTERYEFRPRRLAQQTFAASLTNGGSADISAVRCICEENHRSFGIIDVQAGKQTLGARWCSGLPGELCCQTFDDFKWQLAPRTNTFFGKSAMIFRRDRSQRSKTMGQVSVILRRQVPIRYDELPRSWLGGLPMMSEQIKWPRDAEGTPLHFIAQIACADLPADLWNGHGPRNGWLLLFVQTTKTVGVANSYRERVLHITDFGPECAPPEDTPTVRIELTGPLNGRGRPKQWRKWPVDLVAQYYDLTGTEADAYGSPCIPAEDLYGAAVSKCGIGYDFNEYGIERPLTWRGALYFVEALVWELAPERFKENFSRSFGLLDAPELDTHGFNQAFQQRVNENPDWVALGIGLRRAGCYITAQIETALTSERRSGWMARAHAALERERARYEDLLNKYQQEIDDNGDSLDAKRLGHLTEWIKSQRRCINETEEARAKLTVQFAAYQGPEGEKALTNEIKALGEAHLAWGEKLRHTLVALLETIRDRHLNTPLSADNWARIVRVVEADRTVYWRKYGSFGLEITEQSLPTRRQLAMAIREDFLDFYTRSSAARAILQSEQLEVFESQLRYVEQSIPHRIGGRANMMPFEIGELGEALLFQIATDEPMGWMPEHFDMHCVMTSEKNLQKHLFDQLYITTGGY